MDVFDDFPPACNFVDFWSILFSTEIYQSCVETSMITKASKQIALPHKAKRSLATFYLCIAYYITYTQHTHCVNHLSLSPACLFISQSQKLTKTALTAISLSQFTVRLSTKLLLLTIDDRWPAPPLYFPFVYDPVRWPLFSQTYSFSL